MIIALVAALTLCVILFYVTVVMHDRAKAVEAWANSHHQAALRYVTDTDAYIAALEAAQRHDRACRAGAMLTYCAFDTTERMTMEMGENVP